MKSIYTFAVIIFIGLGALHGQTPQHRTTNTIIIDALAQLPASDQNNFNKILGEISSTGEEGMLQLIGMLEIPGEKHSSAAEYAISGLAHYVATKGKEQQKIVMARACLKGLDMKKETSIRIFLINQLALIAGDESVEKLSAYIPDKDLCAPVSQALASINTEKSTDVLIVALAKFDNDCKIHLVNALSFTGKTKVETPLLQLLPKAEGQLKTSIIKALGNVGTSASLKILEKSGDNNAYLSLINRVLEQGDGKKAYSAAKQMMNKVAKSENIGLQNVAFSTLLASDPSKVNNLLKTALKHTDKRYRNAALASALPYANAELYKYLVSVHRKATEVQKIDILNWFALVSDNAEQRPVIAEVALPVLLASVNDPNRDIRYSAVQSLVKLRREEAIPTFIQLLESSEPDRIALGKAALASFDADASGEVVKVMKNASDEGKIAGLELLAMRCSTANRDAVIEQTGSESPNVRIAAYKALKAVVEESDLPVLYTILEKADLALVADCQNAIVSALRLKPGQQQSKIIIERMEKADKSKKQLYYSILAATNDQKALDIIIRDFDIANKQAKDLAFDALLKWNGPESMDKLYLICGDSSLGGYFIKALNRYIELASSPSLSGENQRLLLDRAMGLAKNARQKNRILNLLGKTNSYLGLLLAGTYLEDADCQQAAANAVMTIALGNKALTGKDVEDLLNRVVAVLNNPDAEYQRQAINKHLNEMVKREPFVLSEVEKKEGFRILFDGRNLDQWTGNTVDYVIEDGCISMHPSNRFGGNLYTKDEFGDFIYRFEFQLTPGANNGVGIRTPMEVDAAYEGMEIQILDHDAPIYKNITPLQVHGSVYGIIGAKRIKHKPTGEWNYQEIYAKGDHIKVILNGEVILDGDIRKAVKNGTADGKEHPGLFNKKGHIGFLGHGSHVKFKNIRIKELN